MRIAISNIAWDSVEDEMIAKLLKKFDIDAIDVAPGKYFSDIENVTDKEINQIKINWLNYEIEITGMQALLFNTKGLNLFGSMDVQKIMLKHLGSICRIGSGLGAKKLVFGSPKNRDCTGLTSQETRDRARSFFQRLGDIARSFGVFICLEPNPPCYGANFMINSYDTAQIVNDINHPCILMQLDTGSLTINNECADEVLNDFAPLIGHVHASEPNLVPLGTGNTDHAHMARSLKKYLPDQIVCIEMLTNKYPAHKDIIEKSLEVAVSNYRNVRPETYS